MFNKECYLQAVTLIWPLTAASNQAQSFDQETRLDYLTAATQTCESIPDHTNSFEKSSRCCCGWFLHIIKVNSQQIAICNT